MSPRANGAAWSSQTNLNSLPFSRSTSVENFLSAATQPVLAKFAGFGARGRAALERSERLHDAGFVPPPIGLADGFLITSIAAYDGA